MNVDNRCEGCNEPVYLTRGFGYSHVDTTLNVSCDARPKASHESVPKIPVVAPKPTSQQETFRDKAVCIHCGEEIYRFREESAPNSQKWAHEKRFSIYCVQKIQTLATPYVEPMASPSTPVSIAQEFEEPLYYIQDTRSYTGNSAMWWCSDGHGYTSDLAQAWKVPLEKAQAMHRSRETDVPWPCEEIDSRAQLHFDMQKLREITNASRAAVPVIKRVVGEDAKK